MVQTHSNNALQFDKNGLIIFAAFCKLPCHIIFSLIRTDILVLRLH